MNSPLPPRRPPNSCRNCGAASYGPVIARDDSGALRPTGKYRCTGCDVVFVDPQDWRGSASRASAPAAGAQRARAEDRPGQERQP